MLQVRKVRQVLQALFLLITVREFPGQPQQLFRGGSRLCKHICRCCQRQGKILFLQVFQALLHALPEGLDLVLFLLVHAFVLFRRQARKGKPRKPKPYLLVGSAGGQGFRLLQIRADCVLIHIGTTGSPAEFPHFLKLFFQIRKGLPGQRKKIFHPAALFQGFRTHIPVSIHTLGKPAFRIRVTDSSLVELQD